MTTPRDILDLPDAITKSAWVVKLTEGVNDPDSLLRTYAITADIKHAFERALSIVDESLRHKRSSAGYIHGSFGSGKSHFMGVLSLMLGADPRPWNDPLLHDLLAKFEWVKTKKFLRLHFHMLGAQSLDQKVFTEYLAQVRAQHPDARIPAIFRDEPLFANAQNLRADLGEEAFFKKINAGSRPSQWSTYAGPAGAWTAARFDEARTSADPQVREQLFSALVKNLLPAFAERDRGFVEFDRGLGILAQHAAELGYDGVVFFFDELILWLANGASNREWLGGEILKLAKMVDSQVGQRAVPFISFVARQRNISELVGEQMAGADHAAVNDNLKYWDGRFDTITLPDRNLPAIVEKRLVRPKDAAAARTMTDAFAQMRSSLGPAWGTLLGRDGDEAAFRRVYPFSPALIEAVISLSNFLQRERTALRLLAEMLVHHMEDFEIGKVVPVGDLFDLLAGGEEPMDGAMREQFATAKRLYQNEILPLLQRENGTDTAMRCQRLRDDHPVTEGCANCGEARCRTDNRLTKTLLLAALVPNAPVFLNMSVTRLVQLNHGTLKSPVPGAEGTLATTKLRKWAKEFGKLDVGTQGDPGVRINLSSVEVRPIIDGARGFDTPGSRRAMLRDLLFKVAEIDRTVGNNPRYSVDWRGTQRTGHVQFGNVREMDDNSLRVPDDAEFKLVIDFPFDEAGHTPQEDETRVAAFRAANQPELTLVWLPSFFAEQAQRDLGELVVLTKLLEGEWKSHVQNLRPEQQEQTRLELERLRQGKRQFLERALDAAYGLSSQSSDSLDPTRTIHDHFHVLWTGGRIGGLVATVMSKAVPDAIHQLLDLRYPRHPKLGDARVGQARLNKNLQLFQRLWTAENQRLAIDRSEAKELAVGDAMGLFSVTEQSASVRLTVLQQIDAVLARKGVASPTVDNVRSALDPDDVMGLTADVADTYVLAYATYSNRELRRGGSALRETTLGKLPNDAELIQPPMPTAPEWEAAGNLAGKLFGIAHGERALVPRNVRVLAEKILEARKRAVDSKAGEIARVLDVHWGHFIEADAPRLLTALAADELLRALDRIEPQEVVAALAAFQPRTSDAALARHLLRASAMIAALDDDVRRSTLAPLQSPLTPESVALKRQLCTALSVDEIQKDIVVELRRIALELLHQAPAPLSAVAAASLPVVTPAAAMASAPSYPPAAGAPGARTARVATAADAERLQHELHRQLLAEPGVTIEVTWTVKKIT